MSVSALSNDLKTYKFQSDRWDEYSGAMDTEYQIHFSVPHKKPFVVISSYREAPSGSAFDGLLHLAGLDVDIIPSKGSDLGENQYLLSHLVSLLRDMKVSKSAFPLHCLSIFSIYFNCISRNFHGCSAFKWDWILSALLDVFLGWTFAALFLSRNWGQSTTDLLSKTASVSSEWLEDLIDEMTGVPAGLKLNQPLASFLGRLYVYHLYVWLTWLRLICRIMPYILAVTSMISLLGISTLVAIISDMLDVITLHLFCFYLYAVKLYSFLLRTCAALLRLFRSRKFNPLRTRVDHNDYEPDQLFVGSLMMTVCVFLLPTVSLFYFVFAGMRFVLLSVKLLSRSLSILIYQPYFSLLLRLLSPGCIVSGFHLRPSENVSEKKIYSLVPTPATVSEISQDFRISLKKYSRVHCEGFNMPDDWMSPSLISPVIRWFKDILLGETLQFPVFE